MRIDPACRSRLAGAPLLLLAGLILALFGAVPPARAQNAAAEGASPAPAPARLSAEQLDRLVAPIALYPDALLAQVLMASAYPVDVVAADRFLQKNPNLTGDQMEQALQKQPWDISVKTLTHFPSVLKYMDDNLDWTQALGDAFANQQSDVMTSVQHMRAEAYAAGNLKSGPQQTVTQTGTTIVIAPTDGQTIYVPQYNPQVVYAQGPTTVVTGGTTVITQPTTTVVTQPGYSTGEMVAAGLLSFTAGVVVGSLIADNNNWCDWNHGAVYVPVYRGPGYGWAGWGRPPAGWGYNGWNNVNHYGNTNVNIHNTNINVNNASFQRWQPNAARRPAAYGGQAGNVQANRDFGYANGDKANLAGGQLGNRGQAGTNALSGYGRGTTTQQNSVRGQQSLGGGSRSTVKPQTYGAAGGNTYKPQANRTAGSTGQNFNRGGLGGGNGVFGSSNSRGFDRQASQRGGGSMRSAQQHGFKPRF
jgi:Protein of unknown function (DUF3300)